MLAETCEDMSELRNYPYLATPKLDGLRCLTLPKEDGSCEAVGRKYKPVGNTFVREWIEASLPAGLDGELVIYEEDGKVMEFNKLSGQLRNSKGQPNFEFIVFDTFCNGFDVTYRDRMRALERMRLPRGRVVKLLPTVVYNYEELKAFEQKCVDEGYEGAMIRSPESPYKQNRSTRKEEYLLKLKRFLDDEGWIIGHVEALENKNPEKDDGQGLTKRSTNIDNMIGKGVVGAFIIKPFWCGEPTEEDYEWARCGLDKREAKREIQKHPYYFSGGTNILDKDDGPIAWGRGFDYYGRIVSFRHWPSVDWEKPQKPRFPSIRGYRLQEEM